MGKTACADARDGRENRDDFETLGDQIHSLGLPPDVVDALYGMLEEHWDDEGCAVAVFEAEEHTGYRSKVWGAAGAAKHDPDGDEPACPAPCDAHGLGDVGEEVAARYLCEEGYEILETNYRTSFGEADLVCRSDDELVFVEVKTRVGEDACPEEAVDRRKIRRYRRIADSYLRDHPSYLDLRFDVIAVNVVKSGHLQVHHFKGVDVWEA